MAGINTGLGTSSRLVGRRSLFANWLMGLFPTGIFGAGLAYSLPMMSAAAYVGGMLYKEE